MFRLVPDQIRIAAGWVRCGQCGVVFNASAHMLPYEQTECPGASPTPPDLLKPAQFAPPPPPAPPAWSEASAASPKADAAAPEPPSEAFAPTRSDAIGEPDDAGALPAATAGDASAADARGAPVTPEPPAVSPPATPASPQAEPGASGFGAPERASAPASDMPPDTESGADEATEDEPPEPPEPPTLFAQTRLAGQWPAPSFVAEARRRAFWSSGPIRGLLGLALLLLLVALALQIALSGRDWLAAREPRLAPVLRALCAPLGCRIQPYRQLDAIIIDGSSFKRAEGGSFRFSVTLHNASALPVASPALELTLTDARDHPLVRRVVTASELGAPPTLVAHGEFNGASTFTVSEDANPGAITGYFLTAFYP